MKYMVQNPGAGKMFVIILNNYLIDEHFLTRDVLLKNSLWKK